MASPTIHGNNRVGMLLLGSDISQVSLKDDGGSWQVSLHSRLAALDRPANRPRTRRAAFAETYPAASLYPVEKSRRRIKSSHLEPASPDGTKRKESAPGRSRAITAAPRANIRSAADPICCWPLP